MVVPLALEVVAKVPLMYDTMEKCLLLIFTRNPELGKCKTRLAKSIGDKSALKIYKILLNHTCMITKDLKIDKAVYYSEKVRSNDIWDKKIYQKFKQKGSHLGLRMLNAFNDSFASGYDRVVIVGSDILDLKQNHINQAFLALKKNDVVLGPAKDGGYYLLGMNKAHSNIFSNKEWGTNNVLENTLIDLKNQKVHLLEILNDIDVYDDIRHHNILKPFLIHE